ncbi:MAG: copper resistance protein CopC [Mycobacterium sp.]|nr:copper resistance protein CopC [Mycobacterium sp.]
MNRFIRPVLGLLVAILLSLAGAAVASAHAALIATDPPENAALATGPDHVSATFNEEMQPEFAAMTVVGPDGNIWSTGSPEVHGAVVSTAVRPLGPVGTYTVNYRATSADGHVVAGAWSFRLTQSGAGEPGPAAAAPAPASGLPAWPFLAGAVVLIALAAWWAVRRRT